MVNNKKLIQISIRIEVDTLKEIDRLVKRNRLEKGIEYNRSSIFRIAVRKYIEKQ